MNVWRHAYRAGSSCRWVVFSDNVRERGVVSTLSLGLECRFLKDVCLNYVCLAAFMWGWALMRLVAVQPLNGGTGESGKSVLQGDNVHN